MYIYKAAVIGAGTMGSEIAQVISYSGIPVVLKDMNEDFVKKGMARIQKIYQGRVDKGKMTSQEMQAKMNLIIPATDYKLFSDVDVVVEAIPEKMDLKKKIFKECDEACPEGTLLASNTSSLSISEIASATKRPGKVVGMHFFYPAHVMKLVEVIPGLATANETVDDIFNFSESLRKIPIRVNECAGFLINRLLMPYLNEAAYCLQEGAASAKEIDAACVAFGLPMGPFTLVDNLGLDVCAEVAEILRDSFGNRMKPAEIWAKLFSKGRFGAKAKAGFYSYDNPNDHTLDQLIAEVQKETGIKKTPFCVERVIFPMINEAALCLEEHVSSASDIDKGMLAGIGFPMAKAGILHYADQIGIDEVLKRLNEFKTSIGDRFWPAPLIKRMAAAGFLGVKTKRGFFEYP
jgi:3-hydroxyacyl-CoA dehydrogenase